MKSTIVHETNLIESSTSISPTAMLPLRGIALAFACVITLLAFSCRLYEAGVVDLAPSTPHLPASSNARTDARTDGDVSTWTHMKVVSWVVSLNDEMIRHGEDEFEAPLADDLEEFDAVADAGAFAAAAAHVNGSVAIDGALLISVAMADTTGGGGDDLFSHSTTFARTLGIRGAKNILSFVKVSLLRDTDSSRKRVQTVLVFGGDGGVTRPPPPSSFPPTLAHPPY